MTVSETTLGSFDYIVVGAGTAGCLLANRLSADPEVRVLLLEAGGRDDYRWIRIPIGYLYTINNPRTDWCFRTDATPGLNGRALNYPRGRVLGGSSAINGMIYMRGQAGDYDGWRALGNPGWGWDDVVPYFTCHEAYARGADALHGAHGEWRVTAQRVAWPILDAVRAGAAELGIPAVVDFNRGDNAGCGYFEVNQDRGRRWSAADAFLHPIARRPNLTVLTHAQARELILESGEARGVRFWHGDKPCRAEAAAEVVLAAGSIGSPQLLELSGIGRGAVLKRQDIAVRHALAGVGENLQDHLQIRAVYRLHDTLTLNQLARSWTAKARMALQYALFRRGPLSMAPSQLGAFARSQPELDRPDLEYHVQPLSTDKLGDPLHPFPGITPSVCHLRPESRGEVHIQDPDARVQPLIRPNYLATEGDRRTAANALRLTRRLMATRALQPFRPEERLPGPDIADGDDAGLARAAGEIGTTIFHPVGTCAMGPDPAAGAVVDARLRVHGVGRLRIADAAIMPRITSGNTNSPTLMIAEKAAAMLRADRRA